MKPRLETALTLLLALSSVSGCNGADPEEPVPDLAARSSVAHCLSMLDLTDPAADPRALELPAALADTGCFDDLVSLTPAPDLIPYGLNSPLWTDGMHKQRFMVVPPEQTIGFSATGDWEFPDGSVLIKAFILEHERGDAASRRSVETRFMVRTGGTWQFFAYRWNEQGTEAYLYTEPETVEFEVREDDGTAVIIAHDFPSRDGCVNCHNDEIAVAGEVLGPRTSQLNTIIPYVSGRQNQLLALESIGLFSRPLPDDLDALPVMPDPADTSAPLELRARSYLHGNCGHCHQPGGYNSTLIDLDLRYDTPLADAHACAEPIRHTIYTGEGEYVIDPGTPDNSNLYGRMLSSGPPKMPPVGRSITDPIGAEVVREWIADMSECP